MLQVDIDKITPVTEARDNLNKIVEEVDNSDVMHVLTKNGTPVAVIVGVNHLEKLTGQPLEGGSASSAPASASGATSDDDKKDEDDTDDKKDKIEDPVKGDEIKPTLSVPDLAAKSLDDADPKNTSGVGSDSREAGDADAFKPASTLPEPKLETADPTTDLDKPEQTPTTDSLPGAVPPNDSSDDLFSDFDEEPAKPQETPADNKSIFNDDELPSETVAAPAQPAAEEAPAASAVEASTTQADPMAETPVSATDDSTAADPMATPTDTPLAATAPPMADEMAIPPTNDAPATTPATGMQYNDFIAPATSAGLSDPAAATDPNTQTDSSAGLTVPPMAGDSQTDPSVAASTDATPTDTADTDQDSATPIHPNYSFDQNTADANAQNQPAQPPVNPAP
jgi:prevent-host-death family protein